jgi:hypothetical protein
MFQESDSIFLEFSSKMASVSTLAGVLAMENKWSNSVHSSEYRRMTLMISLFPHHPSSSSTPLTMMKWRHLRLSTKMPKIHGLEDHLIPLMEQWNDIGDFFKDFIGQAHQIGMKEEQKRTANMRDRVRAANSHSKWEWADKMSTDVRIAKEDVKEKTSRKRKVGNEQPLREQRELEKRQKRRETRRACLNQATLDFVSIEDLLIMNTLEYMDITTS